MNLSEREATQRARLEELVRTRNRSTPRFDDVAAAELHNRLANQIVSQIVNEPIAAGGTMSDVMMPCESVLVGVVLGCFQLGCDVKAFDLIVTRVEERLAKVRLEDLEMKGSG